MIMCDVVTQCQYQCDHVADIVSIEWQNVADTTHPPTTVTGRSGLNQSSCLHNLTFHSLHTLVLQLTFNIRTFVLKYNVLWDQLEA